VKRGVAVRLKVYGGLVAALTAVYFYQPVRIDFFPKAIPNPNPLLDPDSSRLFGKGAKVMVVTAHPDDSEYYLGPALLRLAKSGATIDLVVCTDGDKSYYPWQNGGEMRRIRRQEQTTAAREWKAHSVTFLGYPDGRLQPRQDVVDDLRRQIELRRPEWLVTFDGDYPPRVAHGDHRSAGQAAWLAASSGGGPRWVLMIATHAPNYTADVSDEEGAEHELLAIHKSEFTGLKLEKVSDSVAAGMSEMGDTINKTFGISFRCARLTNGGH